LTQRGLLVREISEILSGCRVIPIVTFDDAATAVPVARCVQAD
jgi:hypothetical protein